MSLALRILIACALGFQFVMASSKPGKDLIAAEKEELAKLANRSDLTVTDWLRFVDEIDVKCENEASKPKKEALCSLYYSFFILRDLFAEAPNQTPTWEDCLRAGVTSDSLSVNESVKKLANRIARKLCPKE